MNIQENKIWCHNCFEWINKYTDIIIVGKDVCCLFCANKEILTHLGYDFEAFPCLYLYLYHKEEQCRCVQTETNCRGDENNCEYEFGRESYEADLKETK
jgi:hypothetical protein